MGSMMACNFVSRVLWSVAIVGCVACGYMVFCLASRLVARLAVYCGLWPYRQPVG